MIEDATPETALAAGDFTTWLRGMEAALDGGLGSEVPCGTCTACCTSSQFVHIGPDETATLAHIDAELLFPAPGRAPGHVLLGYDEHGRCPMLVDGACSIYEHRPVTCRTYDCRVLPAAGLEADDDQPEIGRRARRWRFDHPSPADGVAHDAVRTAAAFLRHDPELADLGPGRATQLAVLAVEIHGRFLGVDPRTGAATTVDADPGAVRVEVRRRLRPR